MSKAVQGAILLGAAGALLAAATGGLGVAAEGFLANGFLAAHLVGTLATLGLTGVSMEAGAIGDALSANRGSNVSIRQPAGFRQIILGNQRVGGIIIYASTTGSHHDQYNRVIVFAGHVTHSCLGLYLDGRKVHWEVGSVGNSTRNGVNFGGHADGNDHVGPDGQTYNFGGLVFCEMFYGDQPDGFVTSNLTANDPNWAAGSNGSPYVGGCTYCYIKLEDDQSMFPGQPEIRADFNGKCDIYDPRTQATGFTTNCALLIADRMTDPVFGLGMGYATEINEAQLIAAANVCDEPVALASGGTEVRYAAHWHGDTSTGPADVIVQLATAMAGRMSRIGGEWHIFPAYWQGPTFAFDQRLLLGDSVQWKPYRSLNDRFNRVTGTYTAPNYPYNSAGNLYDSNGWYDGTIDNTFQYGYQPTNYPQFAMDPLHGYGADAWLAEDGGYPLPKEIGMPCTLSIAQAQRVAKILLMRNRYEGAGAMVCHLAAWGMQPLDVMQFTFPQHLGWENKVLEIGSFSFHVEERGGGSEGKSLSCFVGLELNETGADVYEWNAATEELTPYNVPAGLTQAPSVVAAPTNLSLASTTSTGNVSGLGGDATNYAIQATVTAPQDVSVTAIQMQAKLHANTTWYDAGSPSVPPVADDGTQPALVAYIYGVNKGSVYDVRARALRSNGASSAWVEKDSFTV